MLLGERWVAHLGWDQSQILRRDDLIRVDVLHSPKF